MTDSSEEMSLSAFVPLAKHGLALPLFQPHGRKGNVWYRAISEIDGDRTSAIADFDVYEDDRVSEFESGKIVTEGSPWHDVFEWNGRPFVGTPNAILSQLADHREQLFARAPLSLLDLALASGDPNSPEIGRRANAFLKQKLGDLSGELAFCETVMRSGISLELRRLAHKIGLEPDDELIRFFEVRSLGDGGYRAIHRIDLVERLRSIEAEKNLKKSLQQFALSVGVTLELVHGTDFLFHGTNELDEAHSEIGSIKSVSKSWKSKRSRFLGLAREIAIDLGTTNTRIFVKGEDNLVVESSLVAIKRNMNGALKIIALGNDAAPYQGKSPQGIEVVQPLNDGVIADQYFADELLKHFIKIAIGPRRLFRPLDVIIAVPLGSTKTERGSILKAAESAGASKVALIEAPMAAAIASGLPVSAPVASIIVNIGGGTTEVAIISLNGMAYATSIRSGGEHINNAIISYTRRYHNLLIGHSTAERIKKDFGIANMPRDGVGKSVFIKGRDLLNQVPKEIEIYQSNLVQALAEPLGTVIEGIRIALENVAPELAADLFESKIVLTGGGAMLKGLVELVESETGMDAEISSDPLTCVVRGAAMALSDPTFQDVLLD